jgi:hypothetical protein
MRYLPGGGNYVQWEEIECEKINVWNLTFKFLTKNQ